jgi:hypothetical protein
MPSADWFNKMAVLLGKMAKNKFLKIAERGVVAQFGQRRKISPCWRWAQNGVCQQIGRVIPCAPPSGGGARLLTSRIAANPQSAITNPRSLSHGFHVFETCARSGVSLTISAQPDGRQLS